jgi:hypothetical protein
MGLVYLDIFMSGEVVFTSYAVVEREKVCIYSEHFLPPPPPPSPSLHQNFCYLVRFARYFWNEIARNN